MMKLTVLLVALLPISFSFEVEDILINYINTKQDKWVAGRTKFVGMP